MYIFYTYTGKQNKSFALAKVTCVSELMLGWIKIRSTLVGRRWVLLLSDQCIVWNGTKLCHTDFTFISILGVGGL